VDTYVSSGDRMQICKRLVKEFHSMFIAYLVVFVHFQKGSGETYQSGE
jgi:hypothetical protein